MNESLITGQGQPLSGLRIVECASFVAVPSGGMALAQLGADVIRIDPIGGGPDFRRWPVAPGGGSLYWAGLNKGKRSLTVDFTSDEGRELVAALIAEPGPDAGILLTNTDRAWLSYENLARSRDDLIHLRVQGHANGKPAVDYTVNAGTGIPDLTGPQSGADPVNHVLPAWDLLTGMTATTGLLAALRDRQRTGRGAQIELALADVALAAVTNLGWLAEAQRSERGKQGNYVYGSFGADFTTRDGGRVMVVALTPSQWRNLCACTGTSDTFATLEKTLTADFTRDADRYQWSELIASVLRPWFAGRSTDEVTTELDRARVLWDRYRSMREVAQQEAGPQGNPLLDQVAHPEIGLAPTAANPLRWQQTSPAPQAAAPQLGAHTDEVLTEILALPEKEIGRLRRKGVIGPHTG